MRRFGRLAVSLGFLCITGCLCVAQTYIFGRAEFAVGNMPVAVAVGDFNPDGVSDLAVANTTDNTVSVLLGQPGGTFSNHVDYPTGTGPVSVATGDFNGDGNLDFAVVNN